MRFAGVTGMVARVVAGNRRHAYVEVDDTTMTARYGPWVVRTELSNIAEVTMSGPYSLVKVIGPARLSFADQGLTFATNREHGVCIRFREPVAGIEPTGRLRHPGLTVTVDDSVGLVAALVS